MAEVQQKKTMDRLEDQLVVWFLDSDPALDKDAFVVLVRCLILGAAASGANTVVKGTVFARGV